MKNIVLALSASLTLASASAQAISPPYTVQAHAKYGEVTLPLHQEDTFYEMGPRLNELTRRENGVCSFGSNKYLCEILTEEYDIKSGWRTSYTTSTKIASSPGGQDALSFSAEFSTNEQLRRRFSPSLSDYGIGWDISGTGSGESASSTINEDLQKRTNISHGSSWTKLTPMEIESYVETWPGQNRFIYDGFTSGYKSNDDSYTLQGSIAFPDSLDMNSVRVTMYGAMYDMAVRHQYKRHEILLQPLPVPEPSSYMMLLVGAGLIYTVRPRKARRSLSSNPRLSRP